MRQRWYFSSHWAVLVLLLIWLHHSFFVHFVPGGALITARSETIGRQNDESTVVALCDSGFILPNCSATSSVYRCPTIGQRSELVAICDELPLSEFSHYATTPPLPSCFTTPCPDLGQDPKMGMCPRCRTVRQYNCSTVEPLNPQLLRI